MVPEGGSKAESFRKKLDSMSKQELKELLLVNTYKLALARSQVEALTEVLVKKKIVSYDEVWDLTNKIFKDSQV